MSGASSGEYTFLVLSLLEEGQQEEGQTRRAEELLEDGNDH